MASAKLQKVSCGVVCGARLDDGGNAPRAVVEMESVVVAGADPGVTAVGVNVALDADGNPEAEKEIEFGKPPVAGVVENVNVAVCPAVMVAEGVGALRTKSIPVPVSATLGFGSAELLARVRVAGPNEPTEEGVKVTLMTQVPPPPETTMPLAQVVPGAMAKFAALVAVMVGAAVMVRDAPPPFVTVMDCAALVVFTG